ncbi:hypothetical protein [Microbacterium sp. SS28]|uniref:hypothetical protein n=1 Tax=Microbacterium sp. SS28 TaxID=2919948 RepID=UPI001FAADD63|nr:hypothetical protein [Microbacterium sp. SS28]
MQVEIAEERIILLADRFSLDHAEGRAWSRRADAFGTGAKLGGLLNRATSEDYECVYRERRLQPFWRLHVSTVAAYERTRSYSVAVSPSVRGVEIAGQALPVNQGHIVLTGLESCRDESARAFAFDGLTRLETPALSAYDSYASSVVDAEALAAATTSGTVVVPPDAKASMLVREVMAGAIGKIDADRVLEERVTVDVVDLVYRPVYAFRYRHGAKEAVIEFDGLTGATHPDGATFEQYLGKILEPKFLLDVGVETVNIFVPGTQLVRIVVEQGVKHLAPPPAAQT